MYLTVAEALTIYPLSHAKLVAGEKGLSRILRSVNVIDCPDICDWVKSGEMLFTTAFVMKDHPELALNLLRKMNERGASGLGIKVGRFWDEIPEEIAHEANLLNFPILALPYEFTFSDQMDALFNAEHAKTTKKLRGVLEKQKQLMQFAFKPIDRDNMFHIISGILTTPIAVLGARGSVLFNNSIWTNETLQLKWPWNRTAQWEGSGDERNYRIPMLVGQECVGFLKVFINHPLIMKEEEALFQHAAEILKHQLCVDIEDPSRQDHTGQSAIGKLFNAYFQKEISFHDFSKRWEEQNHPVLNGQYQCVLTTISKDHPNYVKTMNEARQELIFNPLLQQYESIHVYIEEGLFSIYALPSGELFRKGELLTSLSSCMTNLAHSSNEGKSLNCWVSRLKEGLVHVNEAYKECLHTRHISQRLGLIQTVLEIETIELHALFQELSSETMRKYVAHMLEPLSGKDHELDQELVQTLEVYFACDGSINETSRQLFVHRNTVTYRLEKIGDYLQLDFKKINDLLRIKLAFMFKSYLKNTR